MWPILVYLVMFKVVEGYDFFPSLESVSSDILYLSKFGNGYVSVRD